MNQALLDYLSTRRTIPAPQLGEPGPDTQEMTRILRIAARVPDHGKLAPWRFIVYDKACREAAIAALSAMAEIAGDAAETAKRRLRAEIFAAAPIIVGVVSTASEHPKIPIWEQQLSSAAVCMNLVHAANALGYRAQWLTDWFAYDDAASRYLGAADGERFSGFIHIGTPKLPPAERDRPDIDNLTSRWNLPA